MRENPFSGKPEQKAAATAPEGDDEAQLRTISHRHVSTMRRDRQAIRREVVMSADSFLSERLDVEQESATSCLKSILTSKTNAAFVENGKVLLSYLFSEDTGTFAEEVCESWSQIQDVLACAAAGSDTGATLSNTHRKFFSATRSAKTVSRRHWQQLQRFRRQHAS